MAKIFLYDEFNPEDTAMMQALYSRSPLSVTEHVEKVKTTGSGKFMERYYVGYGHQSIADCGSTTLFIEQISILADKAVQDWPLYSGQETSTRYCDMSKQPIVDPVNTPQAQEILNTWMKFYVSNQEKIKAHITSQYPKKSDEDEEMYRKAVAGRGFDVMRGFLPAGITTQLSWHTNLRQAYDKLSLLRYHPLAETRQIAEMIIAKLREKYPHSFSHEIFPDQEKYRQYSAQYYNYYDPAPKKITPEFRFSTTIDKKRLSEYKDLIAFRPLKTNLPLFMAEFGQITYDFLLDFGSFRDIQRHRNGVCRIPLLSTDFGFNSWYPEQLPADMRQEAEALIRLQTERINSLGCDRFNRQYYIALGFNMPCRVTYALPAAVYVAELRSGRSVHPTLRKIAHQMHRALKAAFPELTLYCDLGKDDWDVRRGLQDITKK
jgi:thymidylate synthase ThyX